MVSILIGGHTGEALGRGGLSVVSAPMRLRARDHRGGVG